MCVGKRATRRGPIKRCVGGMWECVGGMCETLGYVCG